MKKRAAVVAALAVVLAAAAVWVARSRRGAPVVAHERRTLARITPDPVADAGMVRVGHASAAPATSGWCKALAASNASIIGTKLVADAGCGRPELDCVVDSRGAAWGFEVLSVKVSTDHDQCSVDVRAGVVRSDGPNRTNAAVDAGLALAEGGQPGFQWTVESGRLRVLGDYDGDGRDEVLVTREWWEHEGGRGVVSTVWTSSGGSPTPYAPARGLVIEDVDDADGDGRLDLVTRGPYGSIEASSALGYTYPIGPAIFLQHVQTDGSFSMTDAVAVAYTKTRCATTVGDDAVTMACDRMRGKSEAAVLADRKAAGCVDFKGDPNRYPQSCPDWMPTLAAVAPPFRL
jgi:hypothetical protein